MTKIDLHHRKAFHQLLSKFPSTAFPVPTKSGEAVMPVVKRLSFWPPSPDPSFKGNPCRAEFSHLSSGDAWLWSQHFPERMNHQNQSPSKRDPYRPSFIQREAISAAAIQPGLLSQRWVTALPSLSTVWLPKVWTGHRPCQWGGQWWELFLRNYLRWFIHDLMCMKDNDCGDGDGI